MSTCARPGCDYFYRRREHSPDGIHTASVGDEPLEITADGRRRFLWSVRLWAEADDGPWWLDVRTDDDSIQLPTPTEAANLVAAIARGSAWMAEWNAHSAAAASEPRSVGPIGVNETTGATR